MEKHKKYLQGFADTNSVLTDEIHQLAAHIQIQPHEDVSVIIKRFLVKLYQAIALISEHRGHPRTPKAKIFDAWESFLGPIKALTSLPHGDFLAARMLLYFYSGLLCQSALDMKFPKVNARGVNTPLNQINTALDDALLESLRRIWVESDKYEEFNWVFTEYRVDHFPDDEKSSQEAQRFYALAQALTPDELAALGGIQGRRFIFAKKADVSGDGEQDEDGWYPFCGSIPGDHFERMRSSVHIPDDDEVEADDWVWSVVGTDGPIRTDMSYCIVDKRADKESWRGLDVLRRSRQFILDARQVGQPFLAEKRRNLAEKTLFDAGIPTEIRLVILGFLDPPVKHPYLSSVDIAAAYTPFPDKDRPKCPECSSGKASKEHILTCPTKSIYIWNLPLRAFFVFHQNKTTVQRLCKYGVNCQGHHDDDDWKVTREEDFINYVESIIKDRCGSPATLSDVGLGPQSDFALGDEEEDDKRRARFFDVYYGPLQDTSNELRMNGGFWGLTTSMLHNSILIGSWAGEDGSATCTTEAEWAIGRHFSDKECGTRAITLMHLRCYWC
ncbi:hypothetical protein NM208_g1555 [Fusarium decemcellulare]|uniref:Uncharacterized protein n=2 Tax=Fusarium decemcellulare TaxID=57161 RepID=A0ACC1SVS2_9HYPO|nr:hypothetical protein NM208_g4968 [Fusarium decemcellulare]KAJ3547361.1 hypothetical protein NM208_g1555 [Fusarium decemcellulare]